jgi:hypothetical protein
MYGAVTFAALLIAAVTDPPPGVVLVLTFCAGVWLGKHLNTLKAGWWFLYNTCVQPMENYSL